MKDKIRIYRMIIVPLKGWNFSSIGEKPKGIKIPFRKIQPIEGRECLLSFCGASCAFQFDAQKYKD